MPPFKLVLVVLGALAFLGWSSYELWFDLSRDWAHPMDFINVTVGALFVLAFLLGREWMRPMGMTLAGVLLVTAVFVFFGMSSANGVKGNPSSTYVTPWRIGVNLGKFALGVLLLWSMRHRDVIGWIVRRESKRLG